MIYSIAVCDPDTERRETLLEMLRVYENEFNKKFRITVYQDPRQAVEKWNEQAYQLTFLHLPQMVEPQDFMWTCGLKETGARNRFIQVCPVRQKLYSPYMFEKGETLPAPLSYRELKRILRRELALSEEKEEPEGFHRRYVKIASDKAALGIVYPVEVSRILFVKKQRKSIWIHTMDQEYYSFAPCEELFERLSEMEGEFIRLKGDVWVRFRYLGFIGREAGEQAGLYRRPDVYFAEMCDGSRVSVIRKEYLRLLNRYRETLRVEGGKAFSLD